MTLPPRFGLSDAEKDALLLEQAEMIQRLATRIAELEAILGKPRKTSSNSHTPPSQDGPGRAKRPKRPARSWPSPRCRYSETAPRWIGPRPLLPSRSLASGPFSGLIAAEISVDPHLLQTILQSHINDLLMEAADRFDPAGLGGDRSTDP